MINGDIIDNTVGTTFALRFNTAHVPLTTAIAKNTKVRIVR
jgi:hypothetical protein